MIEGLFKEIEDTSEVYDYCKWANENYKPGDPISGVWHPIVQAECVMMNMTAAGYKGRWPEIDLP